MAHPDLAYVSFNHLKWNLSNWFLAESLNLITTAMPLTFTMNKVSQIIRSQFSLPVSLTGKPEVHGFLKLLTRWKWLVKSWANPSERLSPNSFTSRSSLWRKIAIETFVRTHWWLYPFQWTWIITFQNYSNKIYFLDFCLSIRAQRTSSRCH